MIFKGKILSTPSNDNNLYSVDVPFLDTGEQMIFEATLCSSPGEYYGYNIGDIVYVAFENNRMNNCIILGKLFVNKDEESTTYKVVSELKVNDKITLPKDTKIGDYNANNIFELYQKITSPGSVGSGISYEIIGEWE